MHITRLLPLAAAGMILLSSCARTPVKPAVQPFKVAFIGDTGFDSTSSPVLDTGFEKVLDLVKSEDAQMLAIAGDFGYEEEKNVAAGYFENINRILGEDFPVVAADGNHDDWSQYMPFFQKRLERMGLPDTLISGEEYGLHFGGIDWVMLATHGDAGFVESHLPGAGDGDWRVCLWHKNMNDMQAGGKSDEMDWATYRACQDAGAIIATGHEHSYARTRTLTDLGNRADGHGATGAPDQVEVGPGRTFVFVSGLGGKSMRDYECDKHEDDTWWATVYTSNYYLQNGREIVKSCAPGTADAEPVVDGYTFGALFITFNAGGDPDKADAYFKNIDGEVIDSFSITRPSGLARR
ncbi:MAG TPA: metallophosphoesterase [Rhodothermales bacterium]|nr:metallophosphoesterase [Rhodothermales bacterium]